jgi:hypothetical protein
MPPTLLTGRELADQIGSSYDDILEGARLGEIPSIRVGGRVFFNLATVVKSIRERQRSEGLAVPA